MKIMMNCILLLLSMGLYADAVQPKIGFFSEEFRCGDAWKKFGLYQELKQDGMTGNAVNSMQWIYGKVSEQNIYKSLSQYHAVVISLDRGYRSVDYKKTTMPFRAALKKYLDNGGGVLLVPQNGEYIQDRRPEIFNIMFGEYGIKMLREGINDPANEFFYQGHPFLSVSKPTAPAYLNFFKTKNIQKSPVTKDVHALFFPQWGCGGMWGTMGLELSKDWQVAVRGEKTARSYIYDPVAAKNNLLATPGQIKSEPVLAATRTHGKGRLAVISCNLMHLTINAHACDWPAVFEKNGDGKTASDGQRLLLNTLHYLAASGMKNPALGTYQEKTVKEELNHNPLNFDRVPFRKADTHSKGVIGIHSSYSDGNGSVAEYAAAARKAGLQFIVFTESLEKLTAGSYAKLKNDCKKYSTEELYVCPGIEFSDVSGLRWAFWGEDILYPKPDVLNADKTRVEWWGLYAASCNRRPSAVLNYDLLHKIGDPSNLWWYFRVPVKVRRKGQGGKADLKEYLFTLQDLREMGCFVFNGIYAPENLADEVRTGGCNVVSGNVAKAKNWLNTKNIFDCNDGYFSEGPLVLQWQGINAKAAFDFGVRRGWQRVRMKFAVSSPDGIKDVKVWDGTNGLFRRFEGNGKKEFSQEFEAVHDQTHHLVLEVTDMQGRRAVSAEQRVINPFYAMTRCSDNMNHLGYSTFLMHPAQHEIPSLRQFEDIYSCRKDMIDCKRTTIAGIDSGVPFIFMPVADVRFNILTTTGDQFGGSNRLDDFNAVLARYPVNSAGISILQQNSTHRVNTKKRHKPTRRIPYCMYSFFPISGPQPIVDIEHTAYLFRSRIIPSWRFTKSWIAAKNYQGGLMLHEITFHFKKDITLNGKVPLQLVSIAPGSSYFSAERGYWNTLCAETPGQVIQEPMGTHYSGEIRNEGFLTVLSEISDRRIVLMPSSKDLQPVFSAEKNGTVVLGLGKDGQKIRKGQKISVILAVAAVTAEKNDAAFCRRLADSVFHAPKWKMIRGKLEIRTGFTAVQAENGEAEWIMQPVFQICDLPFVVSGIQNNGAAAYCERNKDNKFVFAPVFQDKMYFQHPADANTRLWAGNVFLASNPALKLTLVIDGQSPKKRPFLEIHNPADRPCKAEIYSPAGTPVFGGTRFSVSIPSGSSVRHCF